MSREESGGQAHRQHGTRRAFVHAVRVGPGPAEVRWMLGNH